MSLVGGSRSFVHIGIKQLALHSTIRSDIHIITLFKFIANHVMVVDNAICLTIVILQ